MIDTLSYLLLHFFFQVIKVDIANWSATKLEVVGFARPQSVAAYNGKLYMVSYQGEGILTVDEETFATVGSPLPLDSNTVGTPCYAWR